MSIRGSSKKLCDLLGIRYPILQAPIGGASTARLAAAVSEAGGLGSVAGTWRQPQVLETLIKETRSLTGQPFAVNLVLEFDIAKQLEVCLSERVPIISFFWGEPDPFISLVHAAGGLVMHTVASASEAERAAHAGVDILVAQGWEAGGHIRGQVSTLALVPRVVDVAQNLPVVAAGGISDGRGVAAALCLGAQGAMLGTRFLLSEESDAHDVYKQQIVRASETDTVYLNSLFDGGWPNSPHRVLMNSTVAEWIKQGKPRSGQRASENTLVATHDDGEIVQCYSSDAPTRRIASGNPEAMALYAGQGVGLVNVLMPAATILENLVAETREALRKGILGF